MEPRYPGKDDDLLGRGMAYKLLSVAFLPHDGRRLPHLLGETLTLATSLADSDVDEAIRSSARRLADRLSGLRRDETEFRSGASVVFGTPSPYPPYEGEYGMASVFMKTQTMADVAGFYRAFGLEVGPGFHDRPDHLAAELEFMHFLLTKEAYAREHKLDDLAAETRKAQSRFLEEHLGSWGPAFFASIARGGGNAFYAAASEFGSRFLTAESERLRVSPKRIRIRAPTPEPESPAGCAPCPDG